MMPVTDKKKKSQFHKLSFAKLLGICKILFVKQLREIKVKW